jgi:PTS system cellobiose-specific IIB component
MKILLVCSAGVTTSILVNNMKKYAESTDKISAYPLAFLSDHIDQCDVILVSPQTRHMFKLIEDQAKALGKGVALMDPKALAKVDGAIIYQQAKDLYDSLYNR